MATLVIDRQILPEPLFSFIGAGAGRVQVTRQGSAVLLTPEVETEEQEAYDIDPADYPDTTAYLNAIPGFVESIRAMENAPASEFTEVPQSWYDPTPQEK